MRWRVETLAINDKYEDEIQGLIDVGILVKGPAGGRSTSYALKEDGG